MQWRAHRSNQVGMTVDFNVLEYRLNDAGKGPFSKNWDKKKNQPKYMYNKSVFGSNATREDQIRIKSTPLTREMNAAPFDASINWQVGDLIPAYITSTSREDAKGSAADNNEAKGEWKDGMWTVVFSRKFGLTNPDDKNLSPGNAYTIGFAVHDDNITTRGHYVYWPRSVGFGVEEADIKATKVP